MEIVDTSGDWLCVLVRESDGSLCYWPLKLYAVAPPAGSYIVNHKKNRCPRTCSDRALIREVRSSGARRAP